MMSKQILILNGSPRIHGNTAALIDAFTAGAVAELGPDLANPVKDAVLLMAAEGDTEENFAPVRAYYKALLDCLGWKDAGIVYAGGNMAVGDIQAHPEQLEAARQLGAAL